MTTELSPLSDEQFRANRFEMVSRLADDLAHEIKNPLNAIVINLEVLKVRAGRGDVSAALDRANVIEHETRRLHKLIDRLLQLLRPERDEVSNLSVDQAFDELLPLIEAQVRLARHEFITDCAVPVFVPVRRDVFKFAMLNLIAATHDRLHDGEGALSVRCSVSDTEVTVEIAAEGAMAPAGSATDHAFAIAGALLGPCGGRIQSAPNGATVILPRGAAV